MKKFLIATAAVFALFAAPTFAGNVQGCDTVAVDGFNYTVKADPTCNFSGQNFGNQDGFTLTSVDSDNDPSTPNNTVLGIASVPGAGVVVLN